MTRREFLILSAGITSASWAECGQARFAQPAATLTAMQLQTKFAGQSIFDRIVDKALAESWQRLPIGELVGRIGLELLGTPYVGWTLEQDVDREFCFVTLEGLDCVTFFEVSLGIARALKNWASFERPAFPKPRTEDLIREVTLTRYRGGIVGDYSSRLHYTTDWVFDNVRKRTVYDVSESLPGALEELKRIDFMSAHVDTYKQLKAHPELVRKIKAVEAEMSRRKFRYVPTAQVPKIEGQLQTGDIVGLVSKTPGMDINHTGMIVMDGAKALFVHASSTQKKVVKDVSISQILAESERDIGLIVARPREPGDQ